jgi:hemerythrin-like domain-containing protein
MTRKKRTARTKDAIDLLEDDHETVRGLLAQIEASTTRAEKKREELLARIATEFRIHARIEEELFYPAFERAGKNGEDEKMFLEAHEEHELVHSTLPALEETDPTTELFSARVKVIKDLIEHHAEEEEEELFPRARKLLGAAELRELGARMAERKRELAERGVKGREAPRKSASARPAAAIR